MNLSISQARVIDPVLTQVAQGYKHAERVGSMLFPSVPVDVRGGTVLEFSRESFRIYAARRAPGSSTLQIGFGYEGKPFKLVQDALNSAVPRELLSDAMKVPKVDMGVRAVNTCMFSLTLTLEAEQAKLATDANSYATDKKLALSASSQWSDPSSDPAKDISTAKEVVRLSAGLDPNRMVISKKGFNALKEHPKIIERFKYTSSDSITAAMLANLFELDVLAVGKSVALESMEDNAPFVDIWGNSAVLAYVPAAPSGQEEPSFGYTYTLAGHPMVETPYWDGDRKSYVYGVTYERLPVLTGIASGFLFQNIVSLS